MTVCRYFLQGTCRFGDRCRFEHLDSNDGYKSSTPGKYGHQDYADTSYDRRYGGNTRNHQSYSQYNYNQHHRNDYRQGYDDYQSSDRYDKRYSSPQRYDSNQSSGSYNQQYGSHQSSGSYNQRYDSHQSSGSYNPRYDSHQSSGSYNQRYNSSQKYDNYQACERYSQNQSHSSARVFADNSYEHSHGDENVSKTKWVSESYKKQNYRSNFEKQRHEPEKDSHVNEKTAPYVNLLKEDATEWELGNIWLFTCYSPLFNKSTSNFPGFTDISHEESRLEAYKAKENNAFEAYALSMKKASEDINRKRDDLKVPSPKLLSLIEKMSLGQDLSFEESVTDGISLAPFDDHIAESMTTDDDTLLANNSMSFSFKQRLTGKPATTASSLTKLSSEDDLYTAIDKLSTSDKEQFLASTFKLGKIPTVPPPRELCI